jgi:hypothetical protein
MKIIIINMFNILLFLIYGVYSQITSDSNIVIKEGDTVVLQVKMPKWKPKTLIYDVKKVDWNGVISGCRATCRYDRRLCNFYIRAAAHDSLSISEGFGGADGSLFLTLDEINRQENAYDSWAFLLSRNVLSLAKRYDTSVADIVAVCGAVATEFQGGPKIIKLDEKEPFMVGRFDNLEPNPAKALPGSNINMTSFVSFSNKWNLTVEELTALMGSHSLVDNRGCIRMNGTMCNPMVESCTDLRMFRWSNQYYNDLCSPNIRINNPPVRSSMPLRTLEFHKLQNMCRFTSPELRSRELAIFETEIKPLMGTVDNNALVIDVEADMEDVSWFSKDLTPRQWWYTVHDAWMGRTCQGKVEQTESNVRISNAMRQFSGNSAEWDIVYIRAYKKMVSTGAEWAVEGGYSITGDECPSGYVPALKGLVLDCSLCNEVARRTGTYNCSSNCKCRTGMSNSVRFYE